MEVAKPLARLALEDRTLPNLWLRALEAVPEKPFLRWPEGSLTYTQTDEKIQRLCGGLAALGVRKGSKVAIMLGNSPEFVVTWFATSMLGAIYVPINTDYKGDILKYQLNRADVTHIVLDDVFVARLAGIENELEVLETAIVVRRTGQDESAPFKKLKTLSFTEVAGANPIRPNADIHYTDPMAISFTSGTTGPSKGVLATHCHVVTFALDWIKACSFTSNDKLFSPLPMFHAIATWLGILPTIIMQTTTSFTPRFSASGFWDDVRRFDATAVHGIFAMIPILLKQPARDDDKDVPARVFYIGQHNAEFQERFNCRIVEVYGSTETGIVTYTPFDEPAKPGSCGRPNSDSYEVIVADEYDNETPPGMPGEILVRPKQPFSMFKAYYGMAQESVEATRNQWFHTGDTAKRDNEGFLYFVDRAKDAMRRRGENISSFELETVLNADPRVLECAAVAVPSELSEDDVKMVIVPQPDVQLTAQDLWDLCEERMPKFWVPRYFEFRDALPKTPNGKVQKYLLRKGEGQGKVFDRDEQTRQPT